MADIQFIDGLIIKAPNERAPDYVKAKLSIKRADLIDWLKKQDGDWINADIKVSQAGKWFAAVDNWKPDGQRQQSGSRTPDGSRGAPLQRDEIDDDIPFISCAGAW
jgi:hypothetical protein